MFGKLTLDAVPYHEPIIVVTVAAIIIGGLALLAAITYFGKWSYLWNEWLTSVDHKRLGIMYVIVAIVMLLRGFADAIMMRSQQVLASAGEAGFLPPHHYDQIFTAHGVIMIFFVAMPFVIGLMNLVVPLQLGARDVAFPFLNNLSFWFTVVGVILVNLSLGVGEFAQTGWLAYPPLSGIEYSPGVGVDYWIWALQLSGIGTTLIAGEASGDLHASNLMAALKENDPKAEFRFLGGDLMRAVGGTLVKHYREMAFMGFIPVLLNLRTILNNMKTCQEDIRRYQPDVVILIDYPGFNLKIAKYVKTQLGLPVYYYISPKIWAWKQYRIRDFRRYVDRMFCILPFETEFFRKLNYSVDYVGNPSVDSVAYYKEHQAIPKDTFIKEEGLANKPILALLSGSRKQEIKDNLPTMLKVASAYPDYQPVIAGAPGIDPAYYQEYIGSYPAKIVFGKTYPLLQHSAAALVTSGTATLETALFRVPQVVCYYVVAGQLASFIFKHFFHTKYISLVNLIGGREIVQELFGARFSESQIQDELGRILQDPAYRKRMLDGYDKIIHTLGMPGASKRTARLIVESLGS